MSSEDTKKVQSAEDPIVSEHPQLSQSKRDNDVEEHIESLEDTKKVQSAEDPIVSEHPQLSQSKRDNDVEELIESFGTCKWFNVAKGFGFVTPTESPSGENEKRHDIFVYQTVIQMLGFRSLREGEKVKLWYKKSPLGLEAIKVCGPSGGNCVGCERRPKRRRRPDRCYNCGEAGHHAKECQFPPLPKRCHHCKSVDHLVAECTVKRDGTHRHGQEQTADADTPTSS